MRFRDVERQNQSPILRDLTRGSGGLGSGWFDMVGADTQTLNYIVDSGTAQAGGVSTITLAATASATNAAYVGMSVQITSGKGSGDDTKNVISYSGSTKVATIQGTWDISPDSTSVYRIVNRAY